FGPLSLTTEELFSRGPFDGGLELGTFPGEANTPQALQLLGNRVLNQLAATRKDPTFHEPVHLLEGFRVQRDGDLGAAHRGLRYHRWSYRVNWSQEPCLDNSWRSEYPAP